MRSRQLYCSPNYYGTDCDVLCLPNEQRYECDPDTGQKICRRGHFGQECLSGEHRRCVRTSSTRFFQIYARVKIGRVSTMEHVSSIFTVTYASVRRDSRVDPARWVSARQTRALMAHRLASVLIRTDGPDGEIGVQRK
jgi:hypothetical protein